MTKRFIDVDEILPKPQAALLGMQHFLAMFGGTVLVPLLTGFSPSTSLMCSGIGTLIYLAITRGKIPCYLGPSFAVVTPIVLASAACSTGDILSGVISIGAIIIAVSLLIKFVGYEWIYSVFPPYLVSTFILVIAMGLSTEAVNMIFVSYGAPAPWQCLFVAFISAATIILCSCFTERFVSSISILCGVIVGYLAAVFFGLVDFSIVDEAAWLGLPSLAAPTFSTRAIVLIAPIALLLVVDHVAHLFIVGEIVGRDYIRIVHRSLLGDGVATAVSGFLGGLPTTTFAENMGVMSVTKVYATQVYWYAAAGALVIGGFCPKIGSIISSIPNPVIGGVSVLVFGFIVCNGLRTMVASLRKESSDWRMLVIAPTLILGIGMSAAGVTIPVGDYAINSLAFCMLFGVLLNLAVGKLINSRESTTSQNNQEKPLPERS